MQDVESEIQPPTSAGIETDLSNISRLVHMAVPALFEVGHFLHCFQ